MHFMDDYSGSESHGPFQPFFRVEATKAKVILSTQPVHTEGTQAMLDK